MNGLASAAIKMAGLLGAAWALDPRIEPGRHAALRPAGPESARIEWLYWVIFWICLVVFVLMMIGFARAARISSTSVSDRAILEDPQGDRRSAWGVGIGLGITTLALFVVLVFSIAEGRPIEGVATQNDVTIEVTGHQWWWEVAYPNSEADLRITTANEIHVPVGERIAVVMKSGDVIHSFWAPNITGKRDLIPGYASAILFQVDTPGTYHGQCAEFCGLQHAHMGFSVVAESKREFEAWQRQQLQSAIEPSEPETKRGRQVFLTHACVMCHTIRGTTAASQMGPDLTHIASRNRIAAETLPNTPGALAGWILDPQSIKPGNHMAANALAGDELEVLITYLESLK